MKYKFPIEVTRKSTLVLRDWDLLKEIDKNAILPADLKQEMKQGAIILFSISTLDDKLAKILEPEASKHIKRLKTMQKCKEESFYNEYVLFLCCYFLSDSKEQLEETIRIIKEYGADFIFVSGLTLFGESPLDCKTLYCKFL